MKVLKPSYTKFDRFVQQMSDQEANGVRGVVELQVWFWVQNEILAQIRHDLRKEQLKKDVHESF